MLYIFSQLLQNFLKTGAVFSSPDLIRNVYKHRRGMVANKHWNPKYKKLRGLKVFVACYYVS